MGVDTKDLGDGKVGLAMVRDVDVNGGIRGGNRGGCWSW